MKNQNKLLMLFLISIVNNIYSQERFDITIEYVQVNGQNQVENCNTIDLGTTSTNNLTFYFVLNDNTSIPPENGLVNIKVKNNSNQIDGTIVGTANISEFIWNGNQAISSVTGTVGASQIETEGSIIYIEYATSSLPFTKYQSCSHPIIKTPPPSFTLVPSSLSLPCGDVTPRTFEVVPSNIPSGANVTYQWSNIGWSTINTNSNIRTLQPSSPTSLPSSVMVTPYIDGVSQTTETCIVSRSNFTTTAGINGNNYVCGSEVYMVDNLSNNVTIQSVSSSNTNIATVSLTSNNEITVTKITDGIVNISATLQNLCSQATTIVKENIQIGIPNFVEDASITGSSAVCQGQTYTYALNGANHPCVGDANWSVSPNLNVLAQTGTTITVSKNPFSADNAGFITANIPDSDYEFSKGVWVGLPNNQSLSIQKVGVYDLYVDRWTLLKANFTGFQYVVNEPFNLTYDWSIPNSMVRNSFDPSLKSVKPYSIGQLNIGVRVLCDCGYGDWKYRPFTVDGEGGDPIELTPIDD
ncbi:hypothetical protein [Psychroflexus salis]|uniref:Uncharacterized protein n=1 Tax=Psychroflexus salis TaxID=1526574 RepID=A0A917EA01_9FLAO|nr:hypothetical protein [Psychroflexus salis]GGE13633.1 hypothetical protein GCM10010831_13730 [Psychroflexus salis]